MADIPTMHDWFAVLPIEIITIFVSFISSFTELGRMACVSKVFNQIINENDKWWKSLCINWWDNHKEFKILNSSLQAFPSIGKNTNILVWAYTNAQLVDSLFSWKWFGRCIKNHERSGYNWYSEFGMLEFGRIINGKLEGMGIRIHSCWELTHIALDVGLYNDDVLDGISLAIFASGSSYQGICNNDSREGKGIYLFSQTYVKYIGQFKNNCKNGKGSIVWPDGYKITADWKKDLPMGNVRKQLMHFTLKQQVKGGLCTAGNDETKHAQPIWKCKKCKICLCITCWKHYQSLLSNQFCIHLFEYFWFGNQACHCKDKICK